MIPGEFEWDTSLAEQEQARPVEDEWLRPAVAWRVAWTDRAAALTARRPLRSEATHAALLRTALSHGFVVTSGEVAAAGLTRAALRTLINRQEWSQSRRGIYAVVHPGEDARQRAVLRASAAARARPGSVVSCESAAVLHGLPVTRLPVIAVLTASAGTNGDRALVHVRRAALRPAELGSWFGVPVTGVSRTIADLARTDTGNGLMAADAAMRERLVSRAQLRAAADECAGWPGCTGARWVAERADARSESPLESLVRGRILGAGLPSPELQVKITDPSDGWSCRVDFLWRAQRVVLEADGQVKYRTDARALWNEKRRQERLEQLGYRVVRVTWSDIVDRRAETLQRVRRSLGCL